MKTKRPDTTSGAVVFRPDHDRKMFYEMIDRVFAWARTIEADEKLRRGSVEVQIHTNFYRSNHNNFCRVQITGLPYHIGKKFEELKDLMVANTVFPWQEETFIHQVRERYVDYIREKKDKLGVDWTFGKDVRLSDITEGNPADYGGVKTCTLTFNLLPFNR